MHLSLSVVDLRKYVPMNSAILDNSSVVIHGSMIGSHKKTGKIAVLFMETHFEVEVDSNPIVIELSTS